MRPPRSTASAGGSIGNVGPDSGGDEFVAVCDGLGSEDELQALVLRINEALALPCLLGEVEVVVGTSIGSAIGYEAQEAEELIRCADEAMYKAKRSRQGR